jgi:hypothetical protein
MMVINDVMVLVGTAHHRDHTLAKRLGALFVGLLRAPVSALLLDLPHPDGHLRRSQRQNRNWM